ncbi:MAG: hypothetical protein JXR07_18105, partial [Reichenbachiella sp.]
GQLTITNNGTTATNNDLSIIAGNAARSRIFFGDDGSAFIGQIAYNHITNAMNFNVNGSTALLLNSSLNATFSGDIEAVGGTFTSNITATTTNGHKFGHATFERGANQALTVNRLTTTGKAQIFQYDGTDTGEFAVNTTDFLIRGAAGKGIKVGVDGGNSKGITIASDGKSTFTNKITGTTLSLTSSANPVISIDKSGSGNMMLFQYASVDLGEIQATPSQFRIRSDVGKSLYLGANSAQDNGLTIATDGNGTFSGQIIERSSNQTDNILVQHNLSTEGNSSGIGFKVSTDTNNSNFVKGAILFERTSTNGRGDLVFALNNGDDGSAATLTHEILRLERTGQATLSGGLAYFPTIVTKSSAYTLTAADNGKIFYVSGTTTISVPSTMPASGWHVKVRRIGTGTVTIDDNGNTIHSIGSTHPLLETRYTSAVIESDGTDFHADGALT